MKTCTLCKKRKTKDEFNKKKSSKDGLQNKCRQCSKRSAKRHYDENKAYYLEKNKRFREEARRFVNEIKEGLVCQVCGEDEPCCLDFHHKNPNEKDFDLAAVANKGVSLDRIIEEISKCVVVCSNCHRKIHAKVIECP